MRTIYVNYILTASSVIGWISFELVMAVFTAFLVSTELVFALHNIELTQPIINDNGAQFISIVLGAILLISVLGILASTVIAFYRQFIGRQELFSLEPALLITMNIVIIVFALFTFATIVGVSTLNSTLIYQLEATGYITPQQ